MPAWAEYRMCKDLEISYIELQDLPTDVRRMWLAFMAGEGQGRKELVDRAKAERNSGR